MTTTPPQSDRYDGRPLLRLLDAYVLAVIDHLTPDREALVRRVVEETYGGGSNWKDTLKAVAGLPPDLDSRLVALWQQQPHGTAPLAFMLAVSDETFMPLIDAT